MTFLRPALIAPSLLAFAVASACSTQDPANGDGGGGGGTMPTGGASGAATGGTATGGVAGVGTGGSFGGTAGTGFSGGTAGASGSTGGALPNGGTGGSVAGAGGVAGGPPQGGTAGTDAGAGGSTGGSAGSGGGTATGFLVETFESGTVGQQPPTWDNFISYQKNGPNPNGPTLALVDSTRAHGGTKSVHFHGGSSPTMIVKALPANTTRLYVRAWIYITRQLGMNPGANHETLIGIRGTSGSAGDEVRF
ncbi:MAG TPA: hypothetical protein VMS65_01225, partial [Polyangiaceae bacterium]|nr:hypothetical protein [Polyangiaceae bacterium]